VFSNNPNLTSLKLTGNPWKCDCSIYELWDWASVTKGNLAILVGSTTSPEDISTGSGKRKKGLFCHYEANSFPSPKIPSRIRIKDFHASRTWAKYIKESNCVSSSGPKAERYIADRVIEGDTHFYVEDSPPAWIVTVACVSVLIFLAMAVGTGLALLLRRVKKENIGRYSISTKDLEDMESVKEAEEMPKRRRNLKVV
jgi:hypothetical protein